jgi:hypothetical protein
MWHVGVRKGLDGERDFWKDLGVDERITLKWLQFVSEHVGICRQAVVNFFENQCRESRTVLRGVSDSCPHLFHLLSCLGETRREGRTLNATARSRFS